ncbi:MAG: cardiolipin synthase [Nitrospirae bacterium]|nr:cardiolipin synthase [Nitrospirota bacterium]
MLTYLIIATLLIGIISAAVFVVYEKNSPAATMAWLLALLFIPYLGLAAYFLFGRRRLKTRVRLIRAIREKVGDLWETLDFDGSMKDALKATDGRPKYHDLMLLAYRVPGLPPTLGNLVQVQNNAEDAYPAILSSIASAREHIHALYYIIKPDSSGRKFRDALVERAKAGVEVRLLYDDIGCWQIKPDFFAPLVEAGGKVSEYRPVRFARFRTFYANLRNHRKILVIDGQTAYTGGINIGDEYLGLDAEMGFWRDTNVKLTGPAAAHVQLVFAEDWYYSTGELLTQAYVRQGETKPEGGGIVQIVPSGPDRSREQVAQLYFTAITSARKSVYITTPYYIPDEAVQTALVAASLRGVDVRLLVPGKPDRKIIKYASRSYFRELLAAGCKIYEYRKGFIHAKTMSSDGDLAIIGTANMDIRSFRLNFEISAVCYDGAVAEELDAHFMEDIANADRIQLATFSKRPRVDQFIENMARLTSSLL